MEDRMWVVVYSLDGIKGVQTVMATTEQEAREEIIGGSEEFILDGLMDRHNYPYDEVIYEKLEVVNVEDDEEV